MKNNQNKKDSNYSFKNAKSNEEDEDEDEKEEDDEKDEENEDEDEDEDKDEDEDEDEDEEEDEKDNEDKKEETEKNELKKNIKKYENISIDNNIKILYLFNPKRNSLPCKSKNNVTKNIHRTSNLSSNENNQKLKYNYLNNLNLEEKIKCRKRNNSTEMIEINKILNKEILVKNKNTEILYQLKNLNISLEKEKSYINYFKYLTGKYNPYNKNKNKIYNNSNDSSNQKNIIDFQIEIFIKNDDNLHKKVHKSTIFGKLRNNINN